MSCTGGVAKTAQNARLALGHVRTMELGETHASRPGEGWPTGSRRGQTWPRLTTYTLVHTRHSTYTWGRGGKEKPHISLDLLLPLQLKTLLQGVLTYTAHDNGCCGSTATTHRTCGGAIVSLAFNDGGPCPKLLRLGRNAARRLQYRCSPSQTWSQECV